MVFSNSVFLFIFLPASVIVYYFLYVCKANYKIRNCWLLIVSLLFYAWGEPLYIFLMILSILINHLFGLWVEKNSKTKRGKIIVALSCIYNLGMLFVFKYLGWIVGLFIGDAIKEIWLGHVVLPIGISFYTFQALSYVIDVYRGKDKAQRNILNTGLYVAFFPQLVAGPIVRYGSIAKQLEEREHTFNKFSDGAWRFVIGLSKKAILANQLAIIVDKAFGSQTGELSVLFAWVGALCFMLQLYYDFSGYSDMAIGLGKMFGFEFQENFNYPYISRSITEYWRRWHISLGEWFRDYLYYPLTLGPGLKIRRKLGKKLSPKASNTISSILVLFIVWMSTGIWHGANFTFIVWGLIQFVFIVLERYCKPISNKTVRSIVGFITTFLVVLLTKVIFKSSSMGQAIDYFGSMFGAHGNPFMNSYGNSWMDQYKYIIIVSSIFIFPVTRFIKEKIEGFNKPALTISYHTIQVIIMVCLLVVDITYCVSGGYNPFLYFNF